jgi:hypothetical protein
MELSEGRQRSALSAAEGVAEDGAWPEEDVRVCAAGLIGRGAVKVPLLEVVQALDGTVNSLIYNLAAIPACLARG